MANPTIKSDPETETLRLALDTMGVAYAHYDTDDRLTSWNAAYEAMNFKIKHMIAQGAYFPDLLAELVVRGQILDVGPDPTAWVAERLRARRAGDFSYRHLSDGRVFLAQERRQPNGGVFGFWIDVTETAIGPAEPIGRFAQNVGHRLNNMLQVIQGNAELARLAEPVADAAARIDDILAATAEGGEMVRLLLAASGQAAPQLTPFCLNAAVRATLPAGRPPKLDLAADLPLVSADPGWAERCVRLALSPMAGAGLIHIRTSAESLSPPPQGLAPSAYGVLEAQSGPGPAGNQPTDTLELTAVKQMVSRMGGSFSTIRGGAGQMTRLALPFDQSQI